MYTTWFFNNYFRNIDRYCRLMFSIWAKQRPTPSISASDSSKSQFISISVRFVLALIRRNTLYSFCVQNEPSIAVALTLASSFRTRCFSPYKRSLSTNNVCIPFSRNSPNLRILRSTTPSDHFRIVSKQFLATHQEYHSPFPFKRKERLQYSFSLIYTISCFFTFAGTPAAMQLSGISEQTTEPAAITLLLPIRHPGRTITPAPTQTLSPIRISL